jgi:REP element-mobilizing transposase RayT
MPTRKTIPYKFGTFFITFTCYKWIPLIAKTQGYDIIYNWFDYLKHNLHYINGYVIMPNHVHALITFTETDQDINTIIGNGKRFMAYDIIKRLENNNETTLLAQLKYDVDKENKNRLHNVWEVSFNWNRCESEKFLCQKLDYIHNNPCAKKWTLCAHPVEYIHSSAQFYIDNKLGIYEVTSYALMQDIKLTKYL